jgi:uncharacterized protein (DUF1800 family)
MVLLLPALRTSLLSALLLLLLGCTQDPLGETNSAPLASNPQDIALLDRVSWGGNAAGAQLLAQQGTQSYLAEQIHSGNDSNLPRAIQEQIDGLTISQTTPEQIVADLRDERQAIKTLSDPVQIEEAQKNLQKRLTSLEREAQTRALLRDLYSKNQLREEMTWFWFNHFNIGAQKAALRGLVGDYEETAIRPHVFGRFRDLLAATLYHPAMLIYLDNAQNAAGHINENYAREIMELHTLGVNGGYTQQDVQELARILTGVGVNLNGNAPNLGPRWQSLYVRQGLFEFNPKRHDFGMKTFLGHGIAGSGLSEVEQAIDILSRSPSTARRISYQLAQYFVSDDPPEALVDRMAESFQASDGDIARVSQTMFASEEFSQSLGRKFKDPLQFVVSAVRTAYSDRAVVNTAPLLRWLNRLGEPLYEHVTPDGYPITEASWSGSGDMAARFEIARIIASGHTGLFDAEESPAQTVTQPPEIAASRFFKAVAPTLSTATDEVLAQAASSARWGMLYLSSPEFMHR